MAAENLTPDSIAEAAQNPASGAVDGVQVSAVSIPDQILADQYRRTQAALNPSSGGNRSAWGACRAAKAIPKGDS
jgi:hypothetical protein